MNYPAGPIESGSASADQLSALADQLRADGAIGRSEIINRLFEFLLRQSLAGRSPKEVEIAQEVFDKDTAFDVTQDASIRVHIHRLRKKLDEVYAGTTGDRLVIPRGEYRLAIQNGPAQEIIGLDQPKLLEVEAQAIATAGRRFRVAVPRPGWRTIVGALLCLALGILIGAVALDPRVNPPPIDPRTATTFWQPLLASRRPTFVVTGDYYVFGETSAKAGVTRLVREFSINSREDLDEYLMAHPADYGRYVDMDLHYLPASTGSALRELLPLVNGLSGSARAGQPWVISMSRLAPEAFKGSNVVYVGFLSGLGLLRDPLFETSGFTIEANDELIDRASGRHFASDSEQASNTHQPRRDFAYLASIPGPSGNRFLIIAGTRDAAVLQAAEIASDKAQLDQIAARAGNSGGFEALYEVRTLDAVNLGSRLVLARPLKLDSLWHPGAATTRPPDRLTPIVTSGAHAAAGQ